MVGIVDLYISCVLLGLESVSRFRSKSQFSDNIE